MTAAAVAFSVPLHEPLRPTLPAETALRAAETVDAEGLQLDPEAMERVVVSGDYVLGLRSACPGVERAWCGECALADLCGMPKG